MAFPHEVRWTIQRVAVQRMVDCQAGAQPFEAPLEARGQQGKQCRAPTGGAAVSFGKGVSFFVSMDYAPVHISPCPVDKRA